VRFDSVGNGRFKAVNIRHAKTEWSQEEWDQWRSQWSTEEWKAWQRRGDAEQAEDASTVASLSLDSMAAPLQVAMPKQVVTEVLPKEDMGSPPAQQSMPEVAEWEEVVSKRSTRAEKKPEKKHAKEPLAIDHVEEKKPEKKPVLRQQCNCCLLPGLHFADKCSVIAKRISFAEREEKRRSWQEQKEQRDREKLERQLAWQERRDAWEAHQARRESRYSVWKEWQHNTKGKSDDAADASTVASETCNLRS